jgi:hypothetical protein
MILTTITQQATAANFVKINITSLIGKILSLIHIKNTTALKACVHDVEPGKQFENGDDAIDILAH